jgi:hypothetical protein
VQTIRDGLHRFSTDEVQAGGIAVYNGRQKRYDDVDNVHT